MKEDPSEESKDLRARAITRHNQREKGAEASKTDVDLQRLVYELEVHQIELELQNEELVQSRAEVELLLRQYMDLYDFAPLGYFTLARDGTILQANLRGALQLMVERSQLVNRSFGRFVADDYQYIFKTFLQRVFENHTRETIELILLKEMKEPFYASINALATEGSDHCRVVVVDISEYKQMEAALQYQSTHDGLTGLYNRNHYKETVANIARSRQFPISILTLDVDGLKQTNDQQGHSAGDELLRRVARLLISALRTGDMIFRMGGDEFTALLFYTDEPAARTILERVQQALQGDNLLNPESPLRLSIGLSTAEHYSTFLTAIREADDAMYREKRKHYGLQ